ncbi:hypothetical protein [Pseudonocardia yuanmonensis]
MTRAISRGDLGVRAQLGLLLGEVVIGLGLVDRGRPVLPDQHERG